MIPEPEMMLTAGVVQVLQKEFPSGDFQSLKLNFYMEDVAWKAPIRWMELYTLCGGRNATICSGKWFHPGDPMEKHVTEKLKNIRRGCENAI